MKVSSSDSKKMGYSSTHMRRNQPTAVTHVEQLKTPYQSDAVVVSQGPSVSFPKAPGAFYCRPWTLAYSGDEPWGL